MPRHVGTSLRQHDTGGRLIQLRSPLSPINNRSVFLGDRAGLQPRSYADDCGSGHPIVERVMSVRDLNHEDDGPNDGRKQCKCDQPKKIID